MQFTVWIQQANAEGTTFITCVKADNKQHAMELAKQECSETWGETDYPPWDLRVLGIAEGDVKIVAWSDACEGEGCEHEED